MSVIFLLAILGPKMAAPIVSALVLGGGVVFFLFFGGGWKFQFSLYGHGDFSNSRTDT